MRALAPHPTGPDLELIETQVAPRPVAEEQVLPERRGAAASLVEQTPLDRTTFEEMRERARTRLIPVRSSAGTQPTARPALPTDDSEDTPPLQQRTSRTQVDPRHAGYGPDGSTEPFSPPTSKETAETARTDTFKMPLDPVEEDPERELAQVSEARTSASPRQDNKPEGRLAIALVGELAAGVEALVGLLAERIEPGGTSVREYGQLARQIGLELALGERAALGAGVAAQLFALDGLLRRERGDEPLSDLIAVFDKQSGEPGGLNQLLRQVGARCIELEPEYADDTLSAGVVIVALVRDYLDLRCSDPESDLETVMQLLRTGGADPLFVDALVRAVEQAEGHDQRTERSQLGLE